LNVHCKINVMHMAVQTSHTTEYDITLYSQWIQTSFSVLYPSDNLFSKKI